MICTELYFLGTNGQWGGVCDTFFDIEDGHVVCRELGYPGAIGNSNF